MRSPFPLDAALQLRAALPAQMPWRELWQPAVLAAAAALLAGLCLLASLCAGLLLLCGALILALLQRVFGVELGLASPVPD